MNNIRNCSGEGCYSFEVGNNKSFIFLPHLGKRFCFACAVKEMQKIEVIKLPEEITLGFDPKDSKFKKIFEHSRTAKNLWALYTVSHLYGEPTSTYFESEQFLSDCRKFDDSFNDHHGSVEACLTFFNRIRVGHEWWISARLFLGPKNVYYSGRRDLRLKIEKK